MKMKYFNFSLLLLTLLFNPYVNIGIRISLADIIIFAMLIQSAVEISPYKNHYQYNHFKKIFLVLFLYFLFIIAYSFLIQGNNYHDVFGRFRNLFIYPLMFFPGMTLTRSKEDTRIFLKSLNYFIVFSIIIGTIHLLKPISFLTDPQITSRGDYEGVLTPLICFFSVLPFIQAFLNLLFKQNLKVNLFILAICVFGLIGAQNRSAMLTYLFVAVLVLWMGKSSQSIRLRFLTIAITFLILASLSFVVIMNSPFWGKFESRYTRMASEFSQKDDFSQFERRIGRAMATVNAWVKNPVIGSGWGNQINEYPIYDFKGNYIETRYGTPHNYFLALLEQTGLIGFFIMVYFFYWVFKLIRPRENLNPDVIQAYSLFLFFLASIFFNLANVYLYGSINFIGVSFFLWGVGVAHLYHSHCIND